MKRILVTAIVFSFVACNQTTTSESGGQAARDSAATSVQPTTAAAAGPGRRDTVTIKGLLYDAAEITEAEYNKVPEIKPDTSEAVNIRTAAGKVRRSGDSLIFRLENGQEKALVNNNKTDGDDYVEYTYNAYLPAIQSWLVFHAGYEWYAYDLVSARTGEVISTIGIPQFSPDNKYFICSNTDLEAAFTQNGFQLYEVLAEGKVQLLQDQDLESWGPETIKWKDANTLFALQHYYVHNDPEMRENTRFVRLTPRH